MTSFDTTHSVREPNVHYAPINDYSYRFQQLYALHELGYPLDMTHVPNDDENLRARVTPLIEKNIFRPDALHNPYWAKFTADPDFDSFIDIPFFYPNSTLDSTDSLTRQRLRRHPVRLIDHVDRGDVAILRAFYLVHSPDNTAGLFRLEHERSDYPWLEVIERCTVAAKMRLDAIQEVSQSYRLYEEPDDYSFVQKLVNSDVRPINGEQVAGIVSDYYQFIERHFPEFTAFKNSRRRS